MGTSNSQHSMDGGESSSSGSDSMNRSSNLLIDLLAEESSTRRSPLDTILNALRDATTSRVMASRDALLLR